MKHILTLLLFVAALIPSANAVQYIFSPTVTTIYMPTYTSGYATNIPASRSNGDTTSNNCTVVASEEGHVVPGGSNGQDGQSCIANSTLIFGDGVSSSTAHAYAPGYVTLTNPLGVAQFSAYSVSMSYTFDLTHTGGSDLTGSYRAVMKADPYYLSNDGVRHSLLAQPIVVTLTSDLDFDGHFHVARTVQPTSSFSVRVPANGSFSFLPNVSLDVTHTAVPEPASFAVLGVGATTLLRRRKSS